jgi:hypothetical protein
VYTLTITREQAAKPPCDNPDCDCEPCDCDPCECEEEDNGGNTGGENNTGGGTPTTPPAPVTPEPDEVVVEIEDGVAVAEIDTKKLASLVEDEKPLVVEVSDAVTLTFSPEAIASILENADENDIKIIVEVVEAEALEELISEEDLAIIGDRPVFDFSVWSGDHKIDFNGKVEISIPYVLEDDDMHPLALVVFYINEAGELITTLCVYDAENGIITFVVNHFSTYAVAYNYIEWEDVKTTDEFYDAVVYLAARKITTGRTATSFKPADGMERDMVLVMLMRAYGLADESLFADLTEEDYWSDVTDDWSKDILALAKKLGITKGTSLERNEFSPKQTVQGLQLELLIGRTIAAITGVKYDEPDYATTDKVNRGEAAIALFEVLYAKEETDEEDED